jgi:hypothetical protein
LQEGEKSLRKKCEEQQGRYTVQEDAPGATRLEAEEKENDGEFDENERPVPDYLDDEDEAEDGAAVGWGDGFGAEAEAEGAGDA